MITEEQFNNLLIELNIGNKKFLEFIKGKVKRYPVKDFGWGCFPQVDVNNVLIDFYLLVPEFLDEQCMYINIHEYAHAFELFNELGNVYIENKDIRERFAKSKELQYINLRTKKY